MPSPLTQLARQLTPVRQKTPVTPNPTIGGGLGIVHDINDDGTVNVLYNGAVTPMNVTNEFAPDPDTPVLVISVGSQWWALGSTVVAAPEAAAATNGSGGQGSPAPPPVIPYSVKNHGAVGDGSTDDTAAILEAAGRQRVLYFPAGNYVMTQALPITADQPFTLIGDSSALSQITQTSTSQDGIHAVDTQHLTISGLSITGPGSGTGTGINLLRSGHGDTRYNRLYDVVITGFGHDGLAASNPIVSNFDGIISQNNGRYGFYLYGVSGGSAGTSVALNACWAYGNGAEGYHVDTMTYLSFNACAADVNPVQYHMVSCQGFSFNACGNEVPTTGASAYGWILDNCFGMVLNGCWDWNMSGTSVWVRSGSKGIVIIGYKQNTPLPSATVGILTASGTEGTLIDCQMALPNTIAANWNVLNDGSGNAIFGAALTAYGKVTFTNDTEIDGGIYNNGGFIRLGDPTTQVYHQAAGLTGMDGSLVVHGNVTADGSLALTPAAAVGNPGTPTHSVTITVGGVAYKIPLV